VPADRLDLFVDDVEAELLLFLFLVIGGTEGEEGGRGDVAALFRGVCRCQKISSDLLPDEAIKRHIRVDGFDGVISITPGILEKQGASAAARFREPRHVEPDAAPNIPEIPAGEEFVHELGRGALPVGPRGLDEGIDLGRRGRKADEIQGRSGAPTFPVTHPEQAGRRRLLLWRG